MRFGVKNLDYSEFIGQHCAWSISTFKITTTRQGCELKTILLAALEIRNDIKYGIHFKNFSVPSRFCVVWKFSSVCGFRWVVFNMHACCAFISLRVIRVSYSSVLWLLLSYVPIWDLNQGPPDHERIALPTELKDNPKLWQWTQMPCLNYLFSWQLSLLLYL